MSLSYYFSAIRLKRSLAVASLFLAVTLAAQDVPTISVSVKVVNVLATVRDQHGKIVNDLSKDDFTLEEDGRPQPIRYFTRDTDLPLTLGLLVDTSMSQLRVLNEERNASGAFVDDVLRADKDSAFLIHFDSEVELLQDLTHSPLKVSEALNQVEAPSRTSDPNNGGGNSGGRGGRHGGGMGAGTLLYDAVFLASDELMQKQKGRKSIIVLTDGVDHGSKLSLERAIESAQRSDTVVYTIYFTGDEGGGWQRHTGMGGGGGGGRRGGGGIGWPGGGGGWPGGGGGGGQRPSREESPDGKKVLERMSRETGGRMFVVSKKETIGDIYKEIQDELRNQYNLGYTPDKAAAANGDYHKIFLTTKNKDLKVQARDGYYFSAREADAGKGQ